MEKIWHAFKTLRQKIQLHDAIKILNYIQFYFSKHLHIMCKHIILAPWRLYMRIQILELLELKSPRKIKARLTKQL
jgi:hypothetical protein